MDAAALKLVENSGEAQGWYAARTRYTASSGNTYLIMTTDEIYTASPTLYGLTAHKEDMGFTVHVVTETKLDGNAAATGWNEVAGQSPDGKADRMRKWLQNNYIGMQIEYVLLIGNPAPDWGDLPMKNCHYQAYIYPVDGYYADLTGNWDIDGNGFFGNETNDVSAVGGVDKAPEVYVGRIPVYTMDPSWREILRGIIWKTIKYELEANTGMAPPRAPSGELFELQHRRRVPRRTRAHELPVGQGIHRAHDVRAGQYRSRVQFDLPFRRGAA